MALYRLTMAVIRPESLLWLAKLSSKISICTLSSSQSSVSTFSALSVSNAPQSASSPTEAPPSPKAVAYCFTYCKQKLSMVPMSAVGKA